ncbi:hypothetical protein BJV82DRAFT_630197 [Fennellomyces sp. T-0311]|nr:hypothetical protein BJV82DRAFT_630197 [Fennellomyces sp. T-0311]
MDVEEQRTLLRHCNANGICHCDWRLTIYDCEEENAMYYIYIVNIALSGLVVAVGIGIIFHRIFIKGHRLWDMNRTRGCFRPKPVDAMLFLLTTFNILRLISSVILVVDIAPDNLIARSFVFEIPWQFGYGSFALYLVGIAQTLAESHKAISSGWLPSPLFVDILGSWFFLWPFVINNICSLIAGAFAESNLSLAEVFTRLLYGFWFLHNSSISTAVFFAGFRLVRILKGHLNKFKESSGPRYAAIKTGIFKIQAIVGIIIVCLMTFATFLLLYGILRDQIMTSTVGSVILGVIWTYLGPVTTVFVELAILINPSFEKNEALSGYSSTGGGNGGVKSYGDTSYGQTLSGSYSNADENPNANDVVSMNDLQQQQLQYQQLYQKHAASRSNTSPIAEIDDLTSFYKGTRSREKVEIDTDSPPTDYYHRYGNKKDLDDSGSSKFELIT